MRKLLPLLLLVFGAVAGGGAGYFLRPPPSPEATTAPVAGSLPDPAGLAYVKLANQFVVPVMDGGRVGALVVLSLSLEVPVGKTDAAFAAEPRLRDEFLRILFEHANSGGFRGTFTDPGKLVPLRRAFHEVARKVLGVDGVTDVLITDIVRQDNS